MKKKNTSQEKVPKFKKEEFRSVSTDDFDAFMKKILSAPPEVKKKKENVKK